MHMINALDLESIVSFFMRGAARTYSFLYVDLDEPDKLMAPSMLAMCVMSEEEDFDFCSSNNYY